jgi:hypothetical protein
MRLINTATLRMREFLDNRDLPEYAILSHCWGRTEDEVSYQAFIQKTFDEKCYGWLKIARCCTIAQEQSINWVWVDTCCIDKTSSAELTEAINSMFNWYQLSKVCLVFLPDVDASWPPDQSISRGWGADSLDQGEAEGVRSFLRSRWFTRGWTLQELLAPVHVEFFNQHFIPIGTRQNLSAIIAQATGIDEAYLEQRKSIQEASIAMRMYWASGRSTQRIEDIAYSLLGIFNVNMPLIYGEGDKAFYRLQTTIVQGSDDESIFAWGCDLPQDDCSGMLAQSPADFVNSRDVVDVQTHFSTRDSGYELTNKGIRYWYPMGGVALRSTKQGFHVSKRGHRSFQLACKDQSQNTHLMLEVERRGGRWYRRSLWRCQSSLQARQTLSAVLFKFSHIYIMASSTGHPHSSANEESSDHPWSRHLTATVFRLIATLALVTAILVLSFGQSGAHVLIELGFFLLIMDIAPREARLFVALLFVFVGMIL